MTTIRLRLLVPYTYGNKPRSNNTGFVQTNLPLTEGLIVAFESLEATSAHAGSLNLDHYKYFENRVFQVLKQSNPLEWDAQEIWYKYTNYADGVYSDNSIAVDAHP